MITHDDASVLKALEFGWLDFSKFNVDEYEHYEVSFHDDKQSQTGLSRKFAAFCSLMSHWN